MSTQLVKAHPTFDYSLLAPDVAEQLHREEAALDALDFVFRMASVEVGKILLRVKGLLRHGQYMSWLEAHGLNQATAYRYMRLAQGNPMAARSISFKVNDLSLPTHANTVVDSSLAHSQTIPAEYQEHFPHRHLVSNTSARDIGIMHGDTGSEWYTPDYVIALVLAFYDGVIDLDPCSNSHDRPNVPATTHYTAQDNGLAFPWHGKVYVNPPFYNLEHSWVNKAVAEYRAGRAIEVLFLVPGRFQSRWYQPLLDFPFCIVSDRMHFLLPDGSTSEDAALFSPMLVYIGPRVDRFAEVFHGTLGRVMLPYDG